MLSTTINNRNDKILSFLLLIIFLWSIFTLKEQSKVKDVLNYEKKIA